MRREREPPRRPPARGGKGGKAGGRSATLTGRGSWAARPGEGDPSLPPRDGEGERPAGHPEAETYLRPPGTYRPTETIDIQEILKQMCFASNSATCDDHFAKNQPCPSEVYGVSDQYLVLDSFEKVANRSSNGRGVFQYNFKVQGVTGDQNIGVRDVLDTVIGLQVYEFTIPLLANDDFEVPRLLTLMPPLKKLLTQNPPDSAPGPPNPNTAKDTRSQIPFSNRVTLYLQEVGLQSFSDINNRRHHFEFRATLDESTKDRLRLSPVECGPSYFLFTDPIFAIHGITLAFNNPGEALRFPPDILYGAIPVASQLAAFLKAYDAQEAAQPGSGNPMLQEEQLLFTYTDPTNLVNLQPGDRIFIRGFETGDRQLDAWIGRPEGQLVGEGIFGIDAGGDPPPEIYPNGSGLYGPISPASGTTLYFPLNPSVSLKSCRYPDPLPSLPDNTSSVIQGNTAPLHPIGTQPLGTEFGITNPPYIFGVRSLKQVEILVAKNRVRIPLRIRRVVPRLTNYCSP